MTHNGAKLKRITKGPGLSGVVDNVKDAAIKVGILRGQGEHPNSEYGATVAEIAFWNEFGTKRIPARPFLRTTLKAEKIAYKAAFKAALREVLARRFTATKAIGQIGAKVAADIQNTITTLVSPPNSPLTIERKKGKANPLIDSGTLRRSITWGPAS